MFRPSTLPHIEIVCNLTSGPVSSGLHSIGGSPLPLSEIVRLPLFRPGLFPEFDHGNSFAVQGSESSFAMLSQGDHPTLGTPSWYLHPCHTADMVGEILAEQGHSSNERAARWIEAWFLVMGNAVNFNLHESSTV